MITTSDRLLTDYDLHLLSEGTHYRAFEKLGAHVVEGGVHFAVWAPLLPVVVFKAERV